MKLFLLAPPEELNCSHQILTSIGWTVYDRRDVERLLVGEAQHDGPDEDLHYRRLIAVQAFETDAVVLHEDLDVQEAYEAVTFCRFSGLRCVQMMDLMMCTSVSRKVLTENNVAVPVIQKVVTCENETARLRVIGQRLRERVRSVMHWLLRAEARVNQELGQSLKNSNTRQPRVVRYRENDSVTHTN